MRRPFLLSLTQAYVVSFVLLAMWAFFAYSTMRNQIQAQEKYAELINISGKQRMLSQRTAFLAARFLEKESENYRDELIEHKVKMEQDHLYLLKNLPGPMLEEVYYQAPYQLKDKAAEYFNLLAGFIRDPGLVSIDSIYGMSSELLPILDHAVKVYEQESDKRTTQLMRLEGYILFGTVLTLILEALFILRPTLKRANLNNRELERMVREKTERLSIYKQIFANSNDGIIVTDGDNKIVEVNPSFTQVTGFEPEEVMGQKPVVLKSKHLSDEFYKSFWEELYEKGQWAGEFINRKKDGSIYHQFTYAFVLRDEHENIRYHVGIISDVSASKADRQRLEYLALYDMLTGLPNRSYLMSQLASATERAKRYSEKFAVILMDLDNFKWINDTLTHRVGDIVLQTVGEVLKKCTRSMDTVARIGGDEFVLLIEKVHVQNNLVTLLEKIRSHMNEPFMIEGNQIFVTCSMGVAIYPDDATSQEDLLKFADTAMYDAKQRGKNQFSFFTMELNLAVQEQIRIEQLLKKAIERDEFYLLFLPVLHLGDKRIVGYEALLRWNCGDFGVLEPGKFIPVAEAMGLIQAVDYWMLNKVRELLENDTSSTWTVTVNVSAKSVVQNDFVPEIRKVFASSSICSRIIFDIPEKAFLEDPQRVEQVLEMLAEDGFKFAIDNYGSGYSSIGKLKQLPVEFLKIDKSLVQQVENSEDSRKVVAAIVSMSLQLDITVIAEGIESEQQLAYLAALQGCDYGHGYFFTKPITLDELKTGIEP